MKLSCRCASQLCNSIIFGKLRKDTGNLISEALYGSSLSHYSGDTTRRGFIDHKHFDEVELIHMNERVYDYNVGRFMSVDPFIQAPKNSQSVNPYSYIMNNSLAGTDPRGYISDGTIGGNPYCGGDSGTPVKDYTPCGCSKMCIGGSSGDNSSVVASQETPALTPESSETGSKVKKSVDKSTSVNQTINLASNVKTESITDYSSRVIKDVMKDAGIDSLKVTSTARAAEDLSAIMHGNIERHGVDKQKKLYGSNEDKVIDAYSTALASGKSKGEIISNMKASIVGIRANS